MAIREETIPMGAHTCQKTYSRTLKCDLLHCRWSSKPFRCLKTRLLSLRTRKSTSETNNKSFYIGTIDWGTCHSQIGALPMGHHNTVCRGSTLRTGEMALAAAMGPLALAHILGGALARTAGRRERMA